MVPSRVLSDGGHVIIVLIIATPTQTRTPIAFARSVLILRKNLIFTDGTQGLLYSHFGWMLMKQNPKRIGRTDISDLNEDPVVIWQHKHYLKVVFFSQSSLPFFLRLVSNRSQWVSSSLHS